MTQLEQLFISTLSTVGSDICRRDLAGFKVIASFCPALAFQVVIDDGSGKESLIWSYLIYTDMHRLVIYYLYCLIK